MLQRFGGTIALCGLAMLAAAPLQAQTRTIETQSGPIAVETVATGLSHPWGLAELPDGRLLVTERNGNLRLVTRQGQVSAPLKGVPDVYASGQGGLLDVVLAPDFADSRMVYVSFAERGQGGASTAVARGRLSEAGLEDVRTIFRQVPKLSGGNHFGSRLAFAPDGKLFVTTGDRFKFDPAQDLSGHVGKILRLNADGSVPADNPFVGRQNVRPEIWSYGHRNVQGAAIHPQTGALWAHEHGPRGGDELNIAEAGKNYGWPLVSWGNHYSGEGIARPSTRPDLADAIRHWTPVLAASGMAFYTGDAVPGWRGNVFIGGLVSRGLSRLTLEGSRVLAEERIALGARVRDVRMARDGALYVLTDADDGSVLRLSPARAE